ncbi:MAG: hypothetical protein ACK46X_00385 [Candidatus Sericytochromatia bacterium]
MSARVVGAIAGLALLAGCAAEVNLASLDCIRLGVGDTAGTALVLGQVRAPSRAVADGPALGAPLAETPVAGAVVRLADAHGTALPGLPSATTDSGGRYRLTGVPGGHTYVVVAAFPLRDGRPASLRTLARAEAGTVTADLTLATTLVAAGLADVLHGFSANLEAGAYQGAVDEGQALLANDRVPDLADDGDVLALSATLLNVSPRLRERISALKQALATSAAPPLVE